MLWHNNLKYYYTPTEPAICMLRYFDTTSYSLTIQEPSRPPARCWRTPADARTRSGQEDAKLTNQDYDFCVIILFLLFLTFVLLISTRRPISREDAHRMYPRYRRGFYFLTWFTVHSPTNLCEKGWGYHCRVLVWLLAFFAKLNRFFPKKSIKLSKRRKEQVQQSMWPYGLSQTNTHRTSYDSSDTFDISAPLIRMSFCNFIFLGKISFI